MALIEITVDNPSLINTAESDASRETTDGDDSGVAFSSDDSQSDGDGDTDLIETVGTFVTALSALAGVLRQLRSEEESEGGDDLGFMEETEEVDADEPIIGSADETDEDDEAEDETLETGLEGEDEDEDAETEEEASGSGLGAKVAVLLVIVLVVAVLWLRSGDEEAEFEEFDA